jgi:hypothetical protein
MTQKAYAVEMRRLTAITGRSTAGSQIWEYDVARRIQMSSLGEDHVYAMELA